MSASTARPLVLFGPSGCGKSTLKNRLLKDHPDKFGFSISHYKIDKYGTVENTDPSPWTTPMDYLNGLPQKYNYTTRRPRPGEADGREYYFTDREAMQKSIDANEFIESAVYNGNLYGTSKKAVQDVLNLGKVCVLDIDMQGVINLKNTSLNCYYVFVKTPSLEELEKRLRARGTETEESLSKRLDIAKKELEFADTPGNFNSIIINDDLERAYSEFHDTISKNVICLSSS